MNIRECLLPGIGCKFEMVTSNKDKMVIIIHDDGRREVYHYDDYDFEKSISSVTLNDGDARRVASMLGGMDYKTEIDDKIEINFNDLAIEWYKVKENAQVVGKTIGELDIRNSYSVSIIATMKDAQNKFLSPGPEYVIHAGDTLVLTGEKQYVKDFISSMLSK